MDSESDVTRSVDTSENTRVSWQLRRFPVNGKNNLGFAFQERELPKKTHHIPRELAEVLKETDDAFDEDVFRSQTAEMVHKVNESVRAP